jgi:PAS domain S-box-containing protein
VIDEELRSSPDLEVPSRLRTIVEAAVRGLADKAIAAELGLSVHTVDAHWRRLRELFQAANRAETIAKYLDWRYQETVATLQREIDERRAAEERLRDANLRLSKAIQERDQLYVQVTEAASQTTWREMDERERLTQIEKAAEASGTMLYEGEFGGGWRKYWVTRNFEQLGHAAADFVSGSIRVTELVPAEDLVANLAAMTRAVDRGEDSFVSYYRFRTADGRFRWIRDRMTLVRDESGTVVRYFGAGTDVTDLAEQIDPVFLLHPHPDEP